MKSPRLLTGLLACTILLGACSGEFSSNYFSPTAALVCGAVDCTPIAEKEVVEELGATVELAMDAGTFQGPRGAQNRLEAQREILSRMIVQEIGLQQAQVMGIQRSKAAVDEMFDQLRSGYDSEEEFQAQLEAEGLSDEAVRDYIERDLIFSQVQEDVAEGTEPTDSEVVEFYNLNRSQYEAQVRIAHIVVCSAFDAATRSCNPGPGDEELAIDIARRAREGESFADLAKQYSVDVVTSDKSGELGYISRGDVVGPIEEAAFNLFEEGDISDPVKTTFGFHIIKLLEFGQPLDAARESIKTNLASQSRAKAFEDWLNDAIKDARINVNPRLGQFDKVSRLVVPKDLEEEAPDEG